MLVLLHEPLTSLTTPTGYLLHHLTWLVCHPHLRQRSLSLHICILLARNALGYSPFTLTALRRQSIQIQFRPKRHRHRAVHPQAPTRTRLREGQTERRARTPSSGTKRTTKRTAETYSSTRSVRIPREPNGYVYGCSVVGSPRVRLRYGRKRPCT